MGIKLEVYLCILEMLWICCMFVQAWLPLLAQVLSVLKVQTQGAISSPQVGGSLASSGLQNNVYDSFLCLSYVA